MISPHLPTSPHISQVLLDFQLAGHQQFLGHFLRLFRDHDPEVMRVIEP